MATYFAPFQRLLATQPLGITDWLVILSISSIEIVLIEIFKKKIFTGSWSL